VTAPGADSRGAGAATPAPAAPRSPFQSGCLGALVVGTVGFVAGFFGPMILNPSANQGPMLGIFITGPGGAVLGFLGGLVVATVRRGRARD
jgi:hypothetical protein